MAKTIAQMTAAEYKVWLLEHPDEAKKLDEGAVQPKALPTGFWQNGQWVSADPQVTKVGQPQ